MSLQMLVGSLIHMFVCFFTSTPSYSCSNAMQYCGSPSWLSHLEIDWCFMVTHIHTQARTQMHKRTLSFVF